MDVRRDEIGYQHLVCDPPAGNEASQHDRHQCPTRPELEHHHEDGI
jgi:hypothetical protein